MRVTDGMRSLATKEAHAAAIERLQKATSQSLTGKRVGSPQDDPGGFARITRSGAGIERWQSREKAVSVASGDAEVAESALASASDIMNRLKEIAIQMADGSASPSDRALGAKEVTELRQQLVDLGNTRGANGYLFGGTRTDAAPFDTAGVFSGNDNAISVETADGVNTRRNPSGAMAFTAAGGRDILADAAALEAALSTNNVAGIQSAIDAVGNGHDQLVRARAEAGLLLDRMKVAHNIASEATLAMQTAQAADSEIDITRAFTGLADAQGAYERSIEISRRTLSLFDIKNM